MKALVLSLLVLAGTQSFADFQLSLWAPSPQRIPAEESVEGFSLGIYSQNANMKGVALSWIDAKVDGDMIGFQSALITEAGTLRGVQWGFFNYCGELDNGYQIGFINYAVSGRGLQIGLINVLKESSLFPVLPIINYHF